MLFRVCISVYIYIIKYKSMFWVLYKILLRVAISSGYVYCLIFDSVVVRVVDYLEFVSELMLLNAKCAIFLLYHGVKLCKNYISMI